MIYFVSDLHLGDGGPLEDFAFWSGRLPRRKTTETVRAAVQAMHRRWSDFSDHVARSAASGAEPVDLVLLGDVFDLLQVEGDICDPRKIDRVAKAHGPWFQALQQAADAGTRVRWVVGNHDREAFDPAIWSRILEYMPYINKENGNMPMAAWRNDEFGIHAEHGSQYDPYNVVPDYADPKALGLGGHIVRGPINALEPRLPLLDLMPDLPTALWYALTRPDGLLAPPLRDFLFAPNRPDADTPDNLDYLIHVEDLICRVWNRKLETYYRRRLRSLLERIARAVRKANDKAPPSEDESEESRMRNKKAENPVVHPLRKFQRGLSGERAKGLSPNKPRSPVRPKVFLNPDPSRPPESCPAMLKILVTGHTHSAGIRREARGAPGRWIETGSWKARVAPIGRSRYAVEQTLDVVKMQREAQSNDPSVEFIQWEGRLGP